ncbi:NUDIX domain-containing protein [Arcicella sp. LKC2W]|uniref:ADP-ribose pyrophosphatase YjhB (NUDIX family) n=1 Tax=Arcicella aurantiaca TaxID=591202 RepID=A0A316E818_9BACT|nr:MULTISPECIES: NUDIX domain-containing protein [Arcicella]MEA5457655.1 NUDIX domain-containing protein [Arcicella sp. LKC2W]PWK26875.1 ADP-ribose pyrophosphatase YjhB (NUDIX family) [Arcicella aurantiaca]
MANYPHINRILVALDCIVFGFDGEDIKLLLIKRNFDPEKGKWSLMGGFLESDEDLEDATNRILYDLTGLKGIYFEEIQTFGKVNRDPVERTLSVCFFALINIHAHDQDSAKAQNAFWINLKNRPELIFDHNEMVDIALERLRYKAALHPIGFELLPEKFTIPQLQKLYEAIYDSLLDRRNFSRKILSTKLLLDTGEKNENSTTKKAILYKLDKDKYQKQFNAFHYFISDSVR